MANTEITKGTIARQEQEEQRAQKNIEAQVKKDSVKFTKAAMDEVLGSYKRTVIDSYIKTFGNNYGDNFDYNTLVNSFRFSISQDKNGLRPDFSFNENSVQFKQDAKEEHQKFNENSMNDFISNDDIIEGNYKLRYLFNDTEEYESYEEGDINYVDIQDLDGEFIPTSYNERYGTFNRINKLGAYTPVNVSAKDAAKESQTIWDKIKGKLLPNIIKKYKL